MQRRIVKITNTYDGTEKWRIQWKFPFFNWWLFHDDDWCCTTWNSHADCEKYLMHLEKNEAKEIIKVEKTL